MSAPQPPVTPPGMTPPPEVPTTWTPPAPPPPEVTRGPGMPVRAIWFLLVGWWLTGIVSAIAWLALVTIIGIPLGIWLINRIPTFLTLRPRTLQLQWVIDHSGLSRLVEVKREQIPWPMRGLWFLLVGWWASAIVMAIGWLLVVLILTLPIGLWMYNRVPFVASLYQY